MFLLIVLLFMGPGEGTTLDPAPQGVECIVFNEKNMTCDWGSKKTPAANYSLYYWYSSNSATECKHYLQTDGINTGCWFNRSELQLGISYFHMHVNASQNGRTLVIPTTAVLQQNLVKPDPPINLTVQNSSSNQLTLAWASTYEYPHCLEHAVKYRSNKDLQWQEVKTNGMLFNLPSVDSEKLYTFYVRSKIHEKCGTTKLWSEFAGPLLWGEAPPDDANSLLFWLQNVLVPVGSLLLLLLLVWLLLRMERVWLVLMPRIPNPSKKFEDLFTAYHGNFSEWAGVSKDAVESFKPSYRESICRVSELLPGGGYLPVSNDSTGKAGRASVDPPPTGNSE